MCWNDLSPLIARRHGSARMSRFPLLDVNHLRIKRCGRLFTSPTFQQMVLRRYRYPQSDLSVTQDELSCTTNSMHAPVSSTDASNRCRPPMRAIHAEESNSRLRAYLDRQGFTGWIKGLGGRFAD